MSTLTHLGAGLGGALVGIYAGGALYHHRLKLAMRRARHERPRLAADELARMIAEVDQ